MAFNDFIKYANNPVLEPDPLTWEGSQIQDGCTIKEGGIYYRFYVAGSGPYNGSGRGSIGLATSSEGDYPYTWTKQGIVLYSTSEEVFMGAARVIKMQDGSWRMYYQTYATSLGTVAGYYATATAGGFPSTWTRQGVIFTRGTGWEGSMVQPQCYIPSWESPDGYWHLLYAGYDGTHWRTGHATATDGLSWTKDTANNPVLDLGNSGDWDAWDALAVGWIKVNGIYYITYDGKKVALEHSSPDYSIWRVGYCTTLDFVTFNRYGVNGLILSETPSNAWETPYYGNEGADMLYDATRDAIDLFFLMSQVSNESQGGSAYRMGVATLLNQTMLEIPDMTVATAMDSFALIAAQTTLRHYPFTRLDHPEITGTIKKHSGSGWITQ